MNQMNKMNKMNPMNPMNQMNSMNPMNQMNNTTTTDDWQNNLQNVGDYYEFVDGVGENYDTSQKLNTPPAREKNIIDKDLDKLDDTNIKCKDKIRKISWNNNSELREDPFDHRYYTKEEFMDYYGNTEIWDIVHPKKILQRDHLHYIVDNYSSNKYSSDVVKELLYLVSKTYN